MDIEKLSSKGQAWFCTTGLPSDVVIDVGDMTFHLHKFPLMSKSRKLHHLITEQETNPTAACTRQRKQRKEDENEEPTTEIEEEEEEEEDQEFKSHITLHDFPGGSDTFETAAKFCYGVKMELSPTNVAPLLCAAELLEMTDEYSEDNLISKCERFLSQSVLRSLKDSIRALKSCDKLMSHTKTVGIVDRCVEAVAARASTTDPSLFGWPVNEAGTEATSGRRNKISTNWFEELSDLSLPLFKRLISAIRGRDLVSPDVVESCLIAYGKRYIPGISRSSRKQLPSTSATSSEDEQLELLETIIVNLPNQKSSFVANSTASIRFLFGLLRTANILNANGSCRDVVEKKIGYQLEQATLDDLLIPSYSYLNETLYDVDCVERILGYFLDKLEEHFSNRINTDDNDDDENITRVRSADLLLVGKLIDGYLSEIASDANLKQERFYKLAVTLPPQARLFDDGLYRAVDVYLKAHPWLVEIEREKICGVMDCEKLTLEACTHAAQNERLPLRTVVQVLFFEQLQLRQVIAGTLIAADIGPGDAGRLTNAPHEEEEEEEVVGGAHEENREGTWRSTVRENQVLRLDMDSMRSRVQELERECSKMKKAIEKIDKVPSEGGGWRSSLARKFGCKFKTQVCDSHESTVVNTTRSRNHRRQ